MGVRKLSVALDETILERVRAEAAAEGSSVSFWLNEAARTRLLVRSGLRAVAEVEAEIGPFPARARERAEAALDRAGVARPARRRTR